MAFAKRLCVYVGCKNPAWSAGMCKNHSPNKLIPKKATKKETDKVTEKYRFWENSTKPIITKTPIITSIRDQIKSYTSEEIQKYFIDPIEKLSNPKTNRNNFFLEIWNERPRVSELSKTYLGRNISTAFFHHILAKSKYPQAEFDKDNIILLTLYEHSNVENDMYKYSEINKRRNNLKIKYNL